MSGIRFDIENQLCVVQAFTGAATVSQNSYQKQTPSQDLSIGRRMALAIYPVVAAGAGSTAQFEVIQADDAALTSNVQSLASVSVAAANQKIGYPIELPIPQGVMSKTYVGLRVTITGGTTTGTYDAYIMPLDEITQFKTFPKVVNAAV